MSVIGNYVLLSSQSTSSFYGLVNSINKAGTGGTTESTSAFNTSGCDFITITIAGSGALTLGTITDTYSNTWSLAIEKISTYGPTRTAIFYCNNPTTGSGHVFTYTPTGYTPYTNLFVNLFLKNGMAGTLDSTNSFNITTAVTSISAGAVTPSVDNSLLIAGLNYVNGTSSASIDSGFTGISLPFVPGKAYAGASAYYNQSTAASINPTWTFLSNAAAAIIAAFI